MHRRATRLLAAAVGVGLMSGVLGAEIDLDISLGEGPAYAIEEVVVLGEWIPDEKRSTSEIANVLDEEALGMLPDSNVGDSLARLTGLSLVGGKYVYVRGLGERYSSTLLDGARLSSPVPFQKTVPLDFLPNRLVRNLLVQKTYSAQYPGDFSGGLVMVRSRALPDGNYANFDLAMGANTETTMLAGLDYRGGHLDQLGFDDGTRAIPRNIDGLSSDDFQAASQADKLSFGNSFYNFWEVRPDDDVRPDIRTSVQAGLRHDFGREGSVGVVVAGRYSNSTRNRDELMNRYVFTGVGDEARQILGYERFTTSRNVDVSGFFSAGVEIDASNSLTLTHVILRQSVDEVQRSEGLSSEDDVASGVRVVNNRLQFTGNEITSTQLSGEHYFDLGPIRFGQFNWRAVRGSAERDSPDIRSYSYAANNRGALELVTPLRQAAGDLSEVFQAPDRVYEQLEDEVAEYGFDLELPLLLGDIDLTFRTGAVTYRRDRVNQARFFRFGISARAPAAVARQEPSALFSEANWAAGFLDVADFSSVAANASGIFPFAAAFEDNDAFYLAVDAQLHPRVRLQGGVRREQAGLGADAYGGNTARGTANRVRQRYDDLLPSVSLTWEFIDDMQLRMAYSRTVNRPSLLEITGSTLRNPDDSNLYRGNVFLQPAALVNYDARWEWYFGVADSASIGVFYKEFENPIEVGKVQAANDIYTFFNADRAMLKGVELEIRKDLYLDEWLSLGTNWDYLSLTANASFIGSEVRLLGAGQTAADVPLTGGRQLAQLYEVKRELTGQSDILANAILSYRNPAWNIDASLAYNYTGESIILVGERNAPDVVNRAQGRLDLLLKYRFRRLGTAFEVEFRAKNLTNVVDDERQGGLMYERYREGTNYSLGISANLGGAP